MTDNGGPAFASAGIDWHQDGMSLRDYFAAQAMAAIISKLPLGCTSVDDDCEKEARTARGAFAYADAMLAEREKATSP